MALALVGIWIHCDVGQLPQLPYIQAVVGLWLGDRLLRLAKVFWYNYPRNGRPWTRATLECLPGETCRVMLRLPRRISIKPGSNAYLRFSTRP
jgi:hypothetical protein